jgi:hypothetical protein
LALKVAKPHQLSRGGVVRYKVDGPLENPTGISLSIAYEEAPVPEHYYVADFFQIVPQDLEILLIFGKIDHPKTDRLRSKVEVVFPVDLFLRQLWKSSRAFQGTVTDFVERYKSKASDPGGISLEVEKVQTVHANNCLMVLSAGHAMIDFFYISAKELWLRPKRNEPIAIEALVRVITSGSVLLGFLKEADRVAKTYVERLGTEELELDVNGEEDKDENLESK